MSDWQAAWDGEEPWPYQRDPEQSRALWDDVEKIAEAELAASRPSLTDRIFRRLRWLPDPAYYWLLDRLTDNNGWRPLAYRRHAVTGWQPGDRVTVNLPADTPDTFRRVPGTVTAVDDVAGLPGVRVELDRPIAGVGYCYASASELQRA